VHPAHRGVEHLGDADATRRKNFRQRLVVTERAGAAAGEAVEHAGADFGVFEVLHDGAGVVQFVAGADQQGLIRCGLQMREVGELAFDPVAAFGLGVGMVGLAFGGAVGAVLDDVGDGIAKLRADRCFMRGAAILDGVVQQAGDGLVFVAAELDHHEQMVEVRDVRALAALRDMGDAGVIDGAAEAVGECSQAFPLIGSIARWWPQRVAGGEIGTGRPGGQALYLLLPSRKQEGEAFTRRCSCAARASVRTAPGRRCSRCAAPVR
jgi:hypothetical protein